MNNPLILVIDDEAAIRRLLRINLENEHYQVVEAGTAATGIALAAAQRPDLILLDIGLPDQSGHDVLQEIKLWYSRPVLILSALNNEKDIVLALDRGAADYLTKPFRTGELLARIRAALRRAMPEVAAESIITFGKLQIDLARRAVWKEGYLLKLTNTEYQLLAFFVRHDGCVLTHRHLLQELWGSSFVEETQYLRVFVNTLRKKIEDHPNQPAHIITETGVGYRFVSSL
ncbi:MAG: response regulator [Chitinophagales bacterium]